MHLVRCSDQKSATLDSFYAELTTSENTVTREIGKTMLDLITRLRALPDERRVYGLTSHYRLCLLAEDSYTSPWFVIVSTLDNRNFTVEYLMPESVAPWPSGAYVRGEARSEEDAVQMIVTAMEKSEGWNEGRRIVAPMTPEPRFAPPEILAATLFTLERACVYARNLTLGDGADVRQVNELMEAVHELPHFLANWSDDTLSELRLHLSCFDHSKFPGSPNLLALFNSRLENNRD
jgi:hypothetical protein